MSPRATLGWVIALLAAHNVAGNLWLPAWAYVPANLAGGALVVWVALRSGLGVVDVTGPRSWLRVGLWVGAAAGLIVGAGIAVASRVPLAGDLFADDRVFGVGTVGLLYHTLVRIPIGTALFEEVAFRGVLPALGRRLTTPRRANLLAALLFGLWHLLPTTSVAAGNAGVAGFSEGLVLAGGVAGTAVVGLGFSWLRDRRGLAAPVLMHAIVNSVAFAVAWAMA